MNRSEVERIEKELNISLPPHYTAFIVGFEGLHVWIDCGKVHDSNPCLCAVIGFHVSGC